MDTPVTVSSVTSGISCLPMGVQVDPPPIQSSLMETCGRWVLGMTQSPPVDTRSHISSVPYPTLPCVVSSQPWSVNSMHTMTNPQVAPPVPPQHFPQPVPQVPPQPSQADFFSTLSSFMTNMMDRVQNMGNSANNTVNLGSAHSDRDLTHSAPSTRESEMALSDHDDNLEADLQVLEPLPNIPYVQSINRDYREAVNSVYDILSDKISRPSVQHSGPDEAELYPDQSKVTPVSLPISSRTRSAFKLVDSALADLHSRSAPSGASQSKLRKVGTYPVKPTKLSFARYKPLATDSWVDSLKDPEQGSGLVDPKKEYMVPKHIASAIERNLRSDLMILNSLDFFREALSENQSNLLRLAEQNPDSPLALDIHQILDSNTQLISQLKLHLIDLLASSSHSVSLLSLARRDYFLSSVPKHVPDFIVRDLRSFSIYGPRLFDENALTAMRAHTKEYKQEQFQSTLTKGVSKQLSSASGSNPNNNSNKRSSSQSRQQQPNKSAKPQGSFRGQGSNRSRGRSGRGRGKKPQPQRQQQQ